MGASLAQVKTRMASYRRSVRASSEEVERKLALGVAAALIGYGEKSKMLPTAWFGIPSKVWLAGVGYIVAYNASGAARRLANAASDGAIATYAYNAARTGAIVAGDDDYVGDDVVEVQGDEI